jgi:hypothetical protein
VLGVSPSVAAVLGDVRGSVVDPQGLSVPAVHLTLRAEASALSWTLDGDIEGEFLFRHVPLGEYRLCAEAPGFRPAEKRVTGVSDSAPLLRLALSLAPVATTADVEAKAADIGSEAPTPSMLVARQDIERTPGADRSNSLAMITNVTPGAYMTHDQLHVRGGHQVSWLLDGIPIPNTNIASNVGPQLDPKDIDYLEVQRGAYSAEMGDRTYAIFNVVPRTGFAYEREAELVASYGSFNQTNDQVRLGSHGDRLAYYAIAPLTDSAIRLPLTMALSDFEDAVCAASAQEAGCGVIVTRNAQHFRKSHPPAMQPEVIVPSQAAHGRCRRQQSPRGRDRLDLRGRVRARRCLKLPWVRCR